MSDAQKLATPTQYGSGELQSAIRCELESASHLGVSLDELASTLHRSRSCISVTVRRMVDRSEAATWSRPNFARYFASAAARDAAADELTVIYRAEIVRRRQERAGTAVYGWTPTRALVRDHLAKVAAAGANAVALAAATGRTQGSAKKAAEALCKAGEAYKAARGNRVDYYALRVHAEAAQQQLNKLTQEPRATRNVREATGKQRKYQIVPRGDALPKLARGEDVAIDWSRAKITVCPPTQAGVPMRLAEPVPGGFVDEWNRKRSL